MTSKQSIHGKFPESRPRRLRSSEAIRRLVRENELSVNQLVMPYFVKEGMAIREAIDAMPGQYRFSIDLLLEELEELTQEGVNSILLFGIPVAKDEKGSEAWSKRGVVQKAISAIKEKFPDLLVITDVCLCAYSDHGHCGLMGKNGNIENDSSLDLIAKVALSHAQAGADMVAPSDMMDGRVQAIRKSLDANGFENVSIMSYAAKYVSAFYGPFREAAGSAPKEELETRHAFSPPKDRQTYQMDVSNSREAIREMAMDVEEGADILMVKPALAYLDIVREARETFSLPIAAYAVSGEYSMIKAAAQQGYGDEKALVLECLLSLKRAGASILITYHAKQVAAWLEDTKKSQPLLKQ